MQFARRDDPTDMNDPDAQMLTDPLHRKLLWGLAKGAAMIAGVLVVTWLAATALQDRAIEEGQTAMQRDWTVEQPATATPDATTPPR